MASVSYQLIKLCHNVYQPQILRPISTTEHLPPRFVQIDLIITLDLSIVTHDCLTDRFIDENTEVESSCLIHRFDLDVLRNQDRAYEALTPLLARFGFHPSSVFYDTVIDKIVRHGLRIANWESNRGRKILPLRAKIWGLAVKHVEQDIERVLIRRTLAESASEFERRHNYGMVPAKKSMVKKMLKRVRVEDNGDQPEESRKKRSKVIKSEDCVICLEEIKIGSAASKMPCSHTFHGYCIETWLKQSHYCPICRFEMPT